MSFKPIRTFLTDRLIETDSDFKVYEAAFANDFVGDNNFDKRFHVYYGPVEATVSNQNTTQDIVSAAVTLFFRGLRDNADNPLDTAMDIANQYRVNCLRPNKLLNQVHIKRVVCNSITSEPLPENDQAFKIILSFSINMIYGTDVDLDC